MNFKHFLYFFIFSLPGCGQSSLDACTDSKSYLWNDEIDDNRYEGNEAYWNAITECEDNHG